MEKYIRKLACSNKYQMLYNKTKDMSNIRIFQNDSNFSKLQMRFLYWLSVYNNLYQDLIMDESFISESVIKDEIECDAYLYYKSLKKDKKTKLEEKNPKSTNLTGIPTLIRKGSGK